jgi:hypothetical protein
LDVTETLDEELEGRWPEYLRLYGAGAIYSAFVRVAEIANCVQHCGMTREVCSKWTSALGAVVITPGELHSIRVEANRNLARARRMLNVSGEINYEEFVLVITLLTELDLLSHYLTERGVIEFPSADLLYKEVLAVASSPKNRAAHRSAQASARQNWGVPVHSRWLGTGTSQ